MKRAEWEGANGLVMGDAGCDDLAPAGPAGHEMRLDQAGGDPEIGFGKQPVDLDRRVARRRMAEIDMGGIVAGEMVLDPDIFQHPGIAYQLGQFVAEIGPVQAGGDKDRDIGQRNARLGHGADHLLQEQPVRHRPGDVADQDAGAAAAPG
jgi:hypothetical protein